MTKPKKRHKPGVIRDTPLLNRYEVSDMLKQKLNPYELTALEKQVERLQREAVEENIVPAVCDTHKLDFGITLRILKDRFGYESEQLRAFFDLVQDYMRDYDEGRLNLREILNTLEHEDGIQLTWKVNLNGVR